VLPAFLLSLFLSTASSAAASLSLSGSWRFGLDPSDSGLTEEWFAKPLPSQIQLPGILQAQGYGNDISTNTPWVLSLYDRNWFLRDDYKAYTRPGEVKVPFLCQPPKHYLGAAWYQRDITIPTSWQGQRVQLFLERPHWETTVWLDDQKVGSCNSLVAPHTYEFGTIAPGKHTLTIRIDNRMILPYRPDAHSVSDSLGSSWNGIAGTIELRSTTKVWLEDAQVFTDIAKKSAAIKVHLGNITGRAGHGTLSAGNASVPVTWTTNGGEASIEVDFGPEAKLWDEFSPNLQHVDLRLKGEDADDSRELVVGLRDFRAKGRDFILNGRPIYLRGTHNGGDFPLTGYPSTDVDYWRKLFTICRQWGLNHMRFHSWCPPEAAFVAADELGFYLQSECGMWNEISPGTPMAQMLDIETERIIKAYGNHPSFVMLSPSNEPKGHWKEALPIWVAKFRSIDPRHLYTTGTGWSLTDDLGPIHGAADYVAIGRIGPRRVRGESGWFGRDYSSSLTGLDVPVVAHELGQWCTYNAYDFVSKFTGYLRPGNFEIFRNSLASHGLLNKAHDFAMASGRFQFECYKEEIEANLRTPGLAGFQLLDLHDYVGQGTALVGLLDTFWEPKGYATPAEFRQFCSSTVPLARLTNRVFTTKDTFEIPVEVAHYGPVPLTNVTARWQVIAADGSPTAEGTWPSMNIPIGKSFPLGNVKLDLSKLAAPAEYRLVVNFGAGLGRNTWNFWLYPSVPDLSVQGGVTVTRSWDEAESKLAAGGIVLFLPKPAELDWTSPPLDRVPVFWNRLMNPGWGRMLGLWCDTNHPALAQFPTAANCDWQWTELLRQCRAINLDRLPSGLQPIVEPIDDWNRNYKLGLIFEAKVGPGRLLACALDLDSELQNRPVAAQLRRSLLDYMAGNKFQPSVGVSASAMRQLFFDTRIMRRLGAQAQADGANGNALVDGDPNTFWVSPTNRRGEGRKYPHEVVITFPAAVAMSGLVLMNRQNDRDHLGDIRTYTVQTSEDGESWHDLMQGELGSTWSPATIKFKEAITTAHLKLVALSGFGTDITASLADVAILYAGPRLPELTESAVEYKRVRSSSTDVDEGTPAAQSAHPTERTSAKQK
jgi:hypothetical protein